VTHTGPVQVLFTATRAVVLCPLGHYVMSGSTLGRDKVGVGEEWAGSWLEARIAWHQAGLDPWVVTCHGAAPAEAGRASGARPRPAARARPTPRKPLRSAGSRNPVLASRQRARHDTEEA
jgi:hypothetical protein